MYCDSAYLFSEENRVEAYNNVKIIPDEKTQITGDSLFYDGTKKIGKLKGNIILNDGTKELKTNRLDYDIIKNLSYYSNGGTLTDSKEKTILISKYGYYYSKSREFFFKDSVSLTHPDYTINSDSLMHNTETEITYFLGPSTIKSSENTIYCEDGWFDAKKKLSIFKRNVVLENKKQTLKGDSIHYNQNNGIGEVVGNVAVIDTSQNMIITGNYSKYFEKDSVSFITGNVLLTQHYEDDTLYLHADTLYSTYDTTKTYRILLAYHKAKFYKSDLQGMADSMVFSDADSTIKLFYDPIIWSKENQMSADYIQLKTYSGKIENMIFNENSFIVSQEDSTKFNQIKGNKMFAHFSDNELYRVDVNRNGQTIYYAKEDSINYIGVNTADCENMTIYVKEQSVKGITFLSETNATLHPLEEIAKEDTFLRGFMWHNSVRPNRKEAVFIWK